MGARQAVPLTPSKSTHLHPLLFYKRSAPANLLESTLLQVFILKNFILFRMNTYKKRRGGGSVIVNLLFLRSNSFNWALQFEDGLIFQSQVASHQSLASRIGSSHSRSPLCLKPRNPS